MIARFLRLMAIVVVVVPALAHAGAKSAVELADLVRIAIVRHDAAALTEVVPKAAPANMVAAVTAVLMTFSVDPQVAVYAVPANDDLALAEVKRKLLLPESLRPFDVRMRALTNNGELFTTEPIGSIVVVGKRNGASPQSALSLFYGNSNGDYILTFALPP